MIKSFKGSTIRSGALQKKVIKLGTKEVELWTDILMVIYCRYTVIENLDTPSASDIRSCIVV